MEFIPLEYQEQYAQILSYINAYKNGVTSDTMSSYGIVYEKNYGVSMIDLKRIAERYRKDSSLAKILWNKGWRETFILSTLIDEPEKYSLELFEVKVESAPTLEILEQLAYNLAWKLDFLDLMFERVTDWSATPIQYFLLKVTTYQLMHKKISPTEAWQRVSNYSYSENSAILNVLQNLLLRITGSENSLHQNVIDYCAKQDSEPWKMLTDVVREYGV